MCCSMGVGGCGVVVVCSLVGFFVCFWVGGSLCVGGVMRGGVEVCWEVVFR